MADNKLLEHNNGISAVCPEIKPAIIESKLNGGDKEKGDDDGLSDEPPDGGTRAILVMISAFVCVGLIFGVINTYSVIYVKIQENLVQNKVEEASSKAGE